MKKARIRQIAQELIWMKENTCQDQDWESILADWMFENETLGAYAQRAIHKEIGSQTT